MDLSFPDEEDIDSLCGRRLPDASTPDAILPRCKDEAVTWFGTERATRLYVCEEHAKEVLRFQEGDDELPDDWNSLQNYASEKGVNPQGHSEAELRARLRYAKDASDLDPHPRVSPCRSCHKLTLVDELGWTERKCPACRGEQDEIDPEVAVEATGK
ncbi:MAG: hypothetical protein ACNS61_14060 [Candidatus Wenzhouxiangella sp. M2_3B_020]